MNGTRYVWETYNYSYQYVEHTDVLNTVSLGSNQYVASSRPVLVAAQSVTWNKSTNQYVASGISNLTLSDTFSSSDGTHYFYTANSVTYPYLIVGSTSSITSFRGYESYTINSPLQMVYTANTRPFGNYWRIDVVNRAPSTSNTISVQGIGVNTVDGKFTAAITRKVISYDLIVGSKTGNASAQTSVVYPNNAVQDGKYYKYLGSDNIDPTSITYSVSSPVEEYSIVPATVHSSNLIKYGGTIRYQWKFMKAYNGGTIFDDGSPSTSLTHNFTIEQDSSYFTAYVVASDTWGYTSDRMIKGPRLQVIPALKAYIGVNGKARTITKAYIGVNGKARLVSHGYIGVNGKAQRWY